MQTQHQTQSLAALPRKAPEPRRHPLALALAVAGLLLSGAPSALAGPNQTLADRSRPAWSAIGPPALHGALIPRAELVESRVTLGGPDVIAVTNCNDSGPGSLRAASGIVQNGGAIDMVDLDCGTIDLHSPITFAQYTVNIFGPGREELNIDGTETSDGVLIHTGAGPLFIANLSINNGERLGLLRNAYGGCISSTGSVYLLDVAVHHCRAHAVGGNAAGGGIHARGYLRLRNCAVSDNEASGDKAKGGGAYAGRYLLTFASIITGNHAEATKSGYPSRGGGAYAMGPSRMSSSTIAGNFADRSAGMELVNSDAAMAEILRSTISGNHANELVGGVYVRGNAEVLGSSIAGNYSGDAYEGGHAIASGLQTGALADVILRNTIISGNHGPPLSTSADFGVLQGSTVDGDHNLITSHTPYTPVPPDTITIAAALGPLQDNGGDTPTHALLPGNNVAIDAGTDAMPIYQFDQRNHGFPRVLARIPGGTPLQDIGAFEYDPDRIFTTGFNF